jgi:sarcosine oxidase delta subunit
MAGQKHAPAEISVKTLADWMHAKQNKASMHGMHAKHTTGSMHGMHVAIDLLTEMVSYLVQAQVGGAIAIDQANLTCRGCDLSFNNATLEVRHQYVVLYCTI